MKSGYDQFFKNARKAADDNSGVPVRKSKSSPRMNLDLASEGMDAQIRRRMNMPATAKRKTKKTVPYKLVGFSIIGLLIALWGLDHHQDVENLIKRVEFSMNGEAYAEEAKNPKDTLSANKKDGDSKDIDSKDEKAMAVEDINYLSKLNERKKELDAREEELNRLEAELQAQKIELDKRLKELENMRVKISSMLEERVKADDQKVDTLVQLYTNMKPPQAAKVFETMDEDLVVELLGRMKKKSAADIMNLLKPEKAQIISEKYAGYKRR
jgi:flagellar motility protein MotE (MotC chaperone)